MALNRAYIPYLVWGAGVLAYVMSVINRSSFAALGPLAQQHFAIEATQLSTFMFAQLLTYTALQIPVGILMQRIGGAAVIALGATALTAGQAILAVTDAASVAVLARALVGAGDACMFVCLISLIGNWFGAKRSPTMTQITAMIGQVGQLASVAPLAAFVEHFGWNAGFLSLAGLTFFTLLLVILVLRDSPAHRTLVGRLFGKGKATEATSNKTMPDDSGDFNPPTEAIPVFGAEGSGVWNAIKMIIKRPGVRLAFWVHFSTVSAAFIFGLLWGTPFLTGGEGLDKNQSSLVVSTMVFTTVIGGVFAGPILTRFFSFRVQIALGSVLLILVSWAAVLLWPGPAPLWLLLVLAVCIGIGGPASIIAFDVLRTHTHYNHLSIATGLVNSGGFLSGIIGVLVVGVVLDLQGAGSPDTYSLGAFRIAMMCQMPLWVLGAIMILIEYPRAKAKLLQRKR
ncbi:MAG: MFS transporter [Microbacteriaceae bacterium]|nr:MFS transporter [Microbacteriaceae bacterium]